MLSKTFAVLSLVLVSSAGFVAGCAESAGPGAKAPPPSPASAAAISVVTSAMRGELRSCYEQGKRRKPTLAGGFVAELKVGPAGAVEAVDAQDVEGLDPTVITCMTNRMHTARFPSPGDKGATIRIPVRFDA